MSGSMEGSGTGFRGDLDGAEAVEYYGTLVDMVDNSIYHLDGEGRFIAIDDAVVEPPERRSRSLARAHDPSSRLHGSLLFAGKRA